MSRKFLKDLETGKKDYWLVCEIPAPGPLILQGSMPVSVFEIFYNFVSYRNKR